MAGGWGTPPVYGPGQDLGGVTGNSQGTLLTTGAASVKGAWTQLIAATPNDISRIILMVSTYGTSSQGNTVVDLACAASGSEASGIVIQNLIVQATIYVVMLDLPFLIKAGSRIAARAGALNATDNVQVQVVGFDSGFTENLVGGAYDTYGYGGSGSITGVSVDPGTTQNTKGVYSQLTASLSNDIAGFFLGFDYQNYSPTQGSDGHILLDLAIGASGSEVIIVPNVMVCKNMYPGGIGIGPSFTPVFWLPLPAGTRIAARTQSASNTTSERLLGVSLYGVRA